jgi:hypothetical protein
MRISQTTREKLQNILKAQGYSIRYEKGNFQGGYCLVMQQKTILINKFHPLESKINTLAEIIRQIAVEEEALTPDQVQTVHQLKST